MAEDIDYTKYGWVPPKNEAKAPSSEEIDYTKYGYVPPESEEGATKSAMMVLSRIGKDIGESAIQGIKNIPSDIEYAKDAIPSYAEGMIKHPLRMQMQGAAGLTELGHGLLNTLSNAAEYTSNRLHLLPKSIADKVPKQRDISSDINQMFGEPQNKGEELGRGLSRNILKILGGAGVARAINPMRLTSGNIARNIMNTREAVRHEYSGANGHYNQLFNEANQRGINQVPINPNAIDIHALEQHAGDKYLTSVQNVLNNPTLQNSQTAISDLGKLSRSLERKDTLTSTERDTLHAARDARDHISNQMFRDNNSHLYQDLADAHAQIQHGYRENVVPYTTSKPIRDYMNGELSESQLVKKLTNNKFNVQRGAEHPELSRRKLATKIIKHLGWPLGAGALLGEGYHFLRGEGHE